MKHNNFRSGKNFRFLLLVIFCLSIFKSNAQVPLSSGYVILNNQDTIYGKVENSHLGALNKCVFVKDGTSKIQLLRPGKVKEFFISPDTYFKSKTVDGKETFLHLISQGEINLYKGNMNLYISCGPGNPSLLSGDKTYIEKDGKKYAVENTSYKTRIKTCLTDSSYYPEIDQLYFNRKHIIKLINEINGQGNLISQNKGKQKIDHQNQFSVDFGYSNYTIGLEKMNYSNDSTFLTYGSSTDLLSSSDVKNNLNAWGIGFSFKRNIKSTNLYLYTGLKYSRLHKSSLSRLGKLYSYVSTGSSNEIPYYTDSIGFIKDQYRYDLSQISIPVGFYHEITHNLLRPFYSLGISGNYFVKKSISRSRLVQLNGASIVNNEVEIDIPSFSIGTILEVGCRYLIDANYSVSAGIKLNGTLKKQLLNSATLNKLNNRSFYLSLNF